MHCSLTVLFIPQELEPSVGEELCRLFPEDETVDIHPHRTSERRVREKKEISRLGPVMVAEWSGGVLTARCPRWDIKCWHPRQATPLGALSWSLLRHPLQIMLWSPSLFRCAGLIYLSYLRLSVLCSHPFTFFSCNVFRMSEIIEVMCIASFANVEASIWFRVFQGLPILRNTKRTIPIYKSIASALHIKPRTSLLWTQIICSSW